MSKNKRIKHNSVNQGARFSAQSTPDYENSPPIFSLEKLQSGRFCFSGLDKACKAMFAEAIYRRKDLTWRQMKSNSRHALGTEKIPKNAIKAPIPEFIKDDVEEFIVFRYHGKRAMVGIRQRDVFFILWFDSKFKLYKH